ncbi:MAG TPA: ATP-binding protein, partial [Thermoguttaceae bacterium]|nr:ATP-binding protein [Thermoguttaceae bacterium]
NILEVNRQACQSLGYTRETLLDLNIADVDTEVLSHEHRKRFWEQVTDGQPVTFEGTQKRKDGSTFPVEVRMALLAAGPTRKILAFVRNLTERKKAEQERITLIATLESQNAELERFTYTVSHDLRSPLITINGYVGMLRQDLAEGDSKQVEEDLSRISNATDKMDHLLRDVLELSRIGRLVNASVEVSMGNLVREAIESVNGQLQESGVQVEIAPALPVVFGDRLRLTEMLQNLIDNAVKYMGDQPEPRIDIGWRRDGDETVFYVRDNGIGINPRYHEKVFGLFDQLNQKMNGSGIGLALARRIVEVHGGRLWVESEGPGHGSTFCFTIAPKDESTQRLDRERSTNSR